MGRLDRTIRATSVAIYSIPIITVFEGQLDAIPADGRTGGDIAGIVS